MVTLGLLMMAVGFVSGFVLDYIAGPDIYNPRIPAWAYRWCAVVICLGSALLMMGLFAALIVSLG